MSKETAQNYGVESATATLSKRVAPIYMLLKWEWLKKPSQGVPTEEDIRKELIELYEQLSSEEFTEGAADSSACGGLEVYRYRDEEGCVHYTFRFTIEETLDWHNAVTSGLEVTT